MPFSFDRKSGRYKDARGRFVSAREVRRSVDVVLDGLKGESDALAKRLASGTLDVDDWHVQMRAIVKQAHSLAHMAAVGGKAGMSASEFGKLGARIRAQFGFLRNFRQEIANGQAGSADMIAARARMYLQGGSQTYEAAARTVAEDVGYTEMRRHLNAAHSCGDCLGYAAQGWVEIGSLPNPGESCRCGGACRCTVSYRKGERPSKPRPKPEPPTPKPAPSPRKPPAPKPKRPPRVPPAPKFGPSKAQIDDLTPADLRAIRRVLGRPNATARDIASLVGAPDNARVSINTSFDTLEVAFYAPGVKASRTIRRAGDGTLYARNVLLDIDADRQGQGLGRQIFGRQVEQASRLGVKELRAEAARSGTGSGPSDLIGYKVWPRFGYDGPIPDAAKGKLPSGLSSAERLSDLMKTPEGRAWWDTNGTTAELKFDLSGESQSRRVWDAYLRQKAAADRPR